MNDSSTRAAALILTATIFGCIGCGTESSATIDPTLPSMNCREVASAMAGNFTNAAQAKADPQFQSIVMHMRPIWVDRIDGLWLYVEQSQPATPDKPFRQRVYQVVDGSTASAVECLLFELPGDPLQFAGSWSKDRPLNELTPDLLSPRAGCSVTLFRDPLGSWLGATAAGDCATTYRESSYATSAVQLTQQETRSWDRGYDSNGKQVWGSTTGPYIFVKTRE